MPEAVDGQQEQTVFFAHPSCCFVILAGYSQHSNVHLCLSVDVKFPLGD